MTAPIVAPCPSAQHPEVGTFVVYGMHSNSLPVLSVTRAGPGHYVHTSIPSEVVTQVCCKVQCRTASVQTNTEAGSRASMQEWQYWSKLATNWSKLAINCSKLAINWRACCPASSLHTGQGSKLVAPSQVCEQQVT